MLEILTKDEYIIAINKPSGLLVHKSFYARCKSFAIQELRNQIGGQHVYPIHRLDRKTSGVLFLRWIKMFKIMNDRFAHAKSKKNT
jgi:tRNA pseudouridine65 synthase